MAQHVAVLGTRGYPSYYGGFETLLRQLVPYLAEHGWRVDVYNRRGATVPDHPRSPAEECLVRGINTPCVDRQSLSTLSHGLTSTAHSAARRPDVALVMNVANGFWLPALSARGIPTVVNVDGMEWERDKWGANAKRAFRAGAKLTARFGSELVYDSHEIGRRWETEFRRTGHFIPYGGAEPGYLAPVLGLTPGSYALFVARFVPENSVHEFLDAARTISRTHDVVIVGSSGYGGELDEKVAELEKSSARVRWLGHVRDDPMLFALWANAGAYFHGHSVGGTNPALVQAMACAAPVIARDTVYNREVLGDAGVFVAPRSDEIAAVILSVLDDPIEQARLRAASSARQQAAYRWAGVCDAYLELLSATATGHGRGHRPSNSPGKSVA